MSEAVRQFSAQGNAAFLEFLQQLRTTPNLSVPTALLTSETMSQPVPFAAAVERTPGGNAFANRFDFGQYLVDVLQNAERAKISLNSGLWNWLALFYFDQFCPVDGDGNREMGEEALYYLPPKFKYNRYYRHLVRSPWLTMAIHGEKSRVLLIPISAKGLPLVATGEIFAQVAGRQGVFRSARVVSKVYDLYFDQQTQRPRKGTGGRGKGSPNRLGIILRQFQRTYDLEWGGSDVLAGILPEEFKQSEA